MKKQTPKSNGKKSGYLWYGITILWILVIWGHSLMAGPYSAAESDHVLSILQPILAGLNLSELLVLFSIRKIAHFTEFFILGMLLSVCIRRGFAKWPLPVHFCTMLTGMLVAICDESIQSFVPGRSSELTDVMIDFSGVFCAVLLLMLIKNLSYFFGRHKKKSV